MHITTQGWYNPPLSKVFGFRVFGNRRGLGGEPGPRCFLSRRSPCRITSFQLPFAAIPPCCPIWTVGRDPRSTRILVGHAVPDCADRAFCPWPAHAGKAASSHHGVESPWWLLALKMKVVVLRLCSIAPSGRPARNRDGCEPMRLPATQQTEGLTHLSRSAIIEQRQRALPISRNRRLRFLSFLGFVPGVPPESITWFLS